MKADSSQDESRRQTTWQTSSNLDGTRPSRSRLQSFRNRQPRRDARRRSFVASSTSYIIIRETVYFIQKKEVANGIKSRMRRETFWNCSDWINCNANAEMSLGSAVAVMDVIHLEHCVEQWKGKWNREGGDSLTRRQRVRVRQVDRFSSLTLTSLPWGRRDSVTVDGEEMWWQASDRGREIHFILIG